MPTIAALRDQFDALPNDVKSFLTGLRELIVSGQLEAALAVLFVKIEEGRYRTLKCALVRKLKCDAAVIDSMFKSQELTRKSFQKLIDTLLGIDIEKGGMEILSNAETVRDVTFHGRKPRDAEKRQAIADGLTFISLFGPAVSAQTGKNPFGDLRGLTAKTKTASKEQTSWIIRGVLASVSK